MMFETQDENVQIVIPKSCPDQYPTVFIKKSAFDDDVWQMISDYLELDRSDDCLVVIPEGVAGFKIETEKQ